MIDLNGKISHFANPRKADKTAPYPQELKQILNLSDVEDVVEEVQEWPKYAITPLRDLSAIADEINVNKIWYKDESTRFGLGSFKALGGAYAVSKEIIRVMKENHGTDVLIEELISGKYKDVISDITVSCATDGNHGRSVAWGAQMFGCKCVIYIHSHVSKGREEAMAKYGAEVVRIDGNYDDSVKQADEDAKKYKRLIISDTSYPGYMEIPKYVALGYTVMFDEIVSQLDGEYPTHLIVQGGVGGLASAACGYFWQKWGEKRPRFIIVEPEQAACLKESAIAGKPTVIGGELETLMAGLACGEVSALAWKILDVGTDDFVTINEEVIAPTMKLLADHDIEAGESAVPGLAVAIVAAGNEKYAGQLGIDKNSKIMVIGTEGATDPQLYEELTGIKVGA